jgi:MFS family permease
MIFNSKFLHVNRLVFNAAVLFGLVTLIEGVLWYFMPLYFESKLNSLFLVGIVIAAHPLAAILASLPAGDLCDKIGRKFVFIIGLAGFIGSFVFLTMDNFYAYFFFMVFYGIFSSMYAISAFVSVLDHSRPHLAGESAGFFTSLEYAGWLFGSMIAGILLVTFTISVMLQILVVFLVMVLCLSFIIFPGKSKLSLRNLFEAEHILAKDRFFLKEIVTVSKLGKPMIAVLAFAFAYGYWEYAVWTFEPIYTNSMGSGILLGALILCLISLPGMISAFIAGKLTDMLGAKKMLPLGSALLIVGQLIFILQPNLLTLAIALIVTSFGALFILIPIDYYMKKCVPANIRGEVEGSAEMLYNLGGVAGPLTIGIALTVSTLSNLFYFTFGLFGLSIILLIFLKDICHMLR